MAKNHDSFIFYRSFFEAISRISDKEKLQIYEAICELALNKKQVELNGLAKSLFILIEPQIIANSKRQTNGKKGGRPPKKTNGYENSKTYGFTKSKTNGYENEKPNENDNVNENENVNENNEVSDTISYRQKAFELIQQTGRLQASPVELENLVAAVKFGCTKKTIKNLLKRRPDIANFNASWTVDELIAQKRMDDKEKNTLAFPF